MHSSKRTASSRKSAPTAGGIEKPATDSNICGESAARFTIQLSGIQNSYRISTSYSIGQCAQCFTLVFFCGFTKIITNRSQRSITLVMWNVMRHWTPQQGTRTTDRQSSKHKQGLSTYFTFGLKSISLQIWYQQFTLVFKIIPKNTKQTKGTETYSTSYKNNFRNKLKNSM